MQVEFLIWPDSWNGCHIIVPPGFRYFGHLTFWLNVGSIFCNNPSFFRFFKFSVQFFVRGLHPHRGTSKDLQKVLQTKTTLSGGYHFNGLENIMRGHERSTEGLIDKYNPLWTQQTLKRYSRPIDGLLEVPHKTYTQEPLKRSKEDRLKFFKTL